MKRLICVLLASFGLLQARGEGKPELVVTNVPNPWSTTVSFTAMSDYYGTIVGGIFYQPNKPGRAPFSFTGVETSRKNRFGASYGTLSLGRKLDSTTWNVDSGDEYGIGFGHRFSLGSKDYPFAFDVGAMYLATYNLTMSRDDVIEPWIRMDLPKTPHVQPYIQLYRFQNVGPVVDDGWFVYAGFIRNQTLGVPFQGKDLAAIADFRFGYGDGPFGTTAGFEYARVTLSLPFVWKSGWSFTPSIIGQTPFDPNRRPRFVQKSDLYFTGTVAYSF